MVEHLLEFRAVEHGVLVALVKGDGTVWTGAGAELAEHAGAEVILVFHEAFLLLAVGSFVELARHLDGIVRAGHLAQTATDALVLVLLFVGHREGTAKAVEHDVRVAVFGILFGNLRGEELTHRGLQTCGEALQSVGNTA